MTPAPMPHPAPPAGLATLPAASGTRRQLLRQAAALLAWPVASQAAMTAVDDHLFGSPVRLLLPPSAPKGVREQVLAGLAQRHRRWNAWKPGDVSDLNGALREGRVARTTPAVAALLRGAARLEQLSLGHFNAGIGALVGAWGFHADRLVHGDAPASSQLGPLLQARPSLADLDLRGLDVRSRNPQLQLDFGAYAKGVALDWALDTLQRQGVGTALVDLGGNLAAMGQPGGRPWQVGIRDPWGDGVLTGLLTQGREAVVTSGSYERWRVAGGERVTHILDPKTGRPAPGLVSLTVVHADAARADAAATALLVAGPARWRALAARLQCDTVLAVHADGRLEPTAAMAERLQPMR